MGSTLSQDRRDMTPEAELDVLRRRLESAERALVRTQRLATLGTLAASIAHEFNNILTPVMSYAQMAAEYPDDVDLVQQALERSVVGTERAAQIAASMLGFIREDPSKVGQISHVGAVLRDALLCLTRPLERDGIDLRTEIGSEAWVCMAPASLQQVLLNLILNARTAMLPEGGVLAVRAIRSTWNTANDWVMVTVEDTGCGMGHQMASRVFEPFFRGSHGDEHGCGLGLAVCARLVTDAGGQIAVRSQLGAGSEFRFSLRAANPDDVDCGVAGYGTGSTVTSSGSMDR